MNITVILCTFNRCQSLSKALESIAASELPDTVQWEVLVVDNNSSDQTHEVVECFRSQHPGRFRYVFEPLQGLSQARNRGISESEGDILVFVDDDVTVERQWLLNLSASLQDNSWAGSGGRILPEPSIPLPPWLWTGGCGDLLAVAAAVFDLGDEPCELDRAPYGTNMAFRRAMFEKHGSFRTDLGRCGTSLMSGEDTEFGRRLIKAGERLRYEPSAVVYHPFLPERLKKEYFLRSYFDFGRAEVREEGARPNVWGIPRLYIAIPHYIFGLLPQHALRWMFSLNTQERFFKKCLLCQQAGRFVEKYRLSRSEKQKPQNARANRKEDQVALNLRDGE